MWKDEKEHTITLIHTFILNSTQYQYLQMEGHSASVYFCSSFPAGPFVPSLPLNISLIYDQEATLFPYSSFVHYNTILQVLNSEMKF